MKKLLTFTFLLTIFLMGCKEEKKPEVTDESKNLISEKDIIEKELNLVVDFNLKTSKPDEFSLKANDVFLNNNQFMDIKIKQKLNYNETEKNIKFELPEKVVPDYQLYISLGMKETKEVQVKNLSIKYGNTYFEIAPDKVEDYFTLNKFIEYSPETGILKTKQIDGKHNPLMFVRKKILDSLSSL